MAALKSVPGQAVDPIGAESLWAELRMRNVDVLALIPGSDAAVPLGEQSGATATEQGQAVNDSLARTTCPSLRWPGRGRASPN